MAKAGNLWGRDCPSDSPCHCDTAQTAHAALGIALVLAAGCGGAAKNAQTAGNEDQPWIDKVEIVGNEAVSEKKLIAGLSTQPPDHSLFRGTKRTRLDPLLLSVDSDRIEGYYRRRGYFSAAVADVDLELVTREKVAVEFLVEEGAASTVWRVQAEGLPEDAKEAREAYGEVAPGNVYEQEAYELAKDELAAALRRSGYAFAKVEGVVEVDRGRERVDVTFLVDSGPKVRFGRVVVSGLRSVPESTVLARAPFDEGDVFDPALLEIYRGRLSELGVFSFARVSLDERSGASSIADVEVSVSESDARELRMGGGVAADNLLFEVRARAGYTQQGVFDSLTTLRADLRPAYQWLRSSTDDSGIGGEAMVELERQDVLLPLTRGLARVSVERTEWDGYTSQGPGGRLALLRSVFGDRLSVGVGWDIALLTFSNVSDVITDEQREALSLVPGDAYRLAFFEQRAVWDARNSALEPTRGYYLEGNLEESGTWSGSQFDYVRGAVEGRGYIPAGERWVFAARVRYGMALAGDLPITQRYFSGGATRQRGFPQRKLAPFAEGLNMDGDVVQVPIGGESLFESNWEVRFKTFRFRKRWVGLVPFLDGANVGLTRTDIDLGNLDWAVGLGLRYDTVIGPLRFDIGRRVTNTGPGDPIPNHLWAFHFSLGEAF